MSCVNKINDLTSDINAFATNNISTFVSKRGKTILRYRAIIDKFYSRLGKKAQVGMGCQAGDVFGDNGDIIIALADNTSVQDFQHNFLRIKKTVSELTGLDGYFSYNTRLNGHYGMKGIVSFEKQLTDNPLIIKFLLTLEPEFNSKNNIIPFYSFDYSDFTFSNTQRDTNQAFTLTATDTMTSTNLSKVYNKAALSNNIKYKFIDISGDRKLEITLKLGMSIKFVDNTSNEANILARGLFPIVNFGFKMV